MAFKTITLDLEAYELLKRHKKGRASFSQVVKDHFAPKPTVDAFRRALQDTLIAESTIEAIDEQIRKRQQDKARDVVL